jgi:hypothetical protein
MKLKTFITWPNNLNVGNGKSKLGFHIPNSIPYFPIRFLQKTPCRLIDQSLPFNPFFPVASDGYLSFTISKTFFLQCASVTHSSGTLWSPLLTSSPRRRCETPSSLFVRSFVSALRNPRSSQGLSWHDQQMRLHLLTCISTEAMP